MTAALDLGLPTGGGTSALDARIRPIDDLAAAGVGWLTGYVAPLQEVVDRMAGNASVIRTFTDAWSTAAKDVGQATERFGTATGTQTAQWQGDSADRYRGRVVSTVSGLQDVTALAAGMSRICGALAEGVAAARTASGDLLADLVRRLIDFARPAVAAEGVTPAVLAQATAMINSYATPLAAHEQRVETAVARAAPALLALVPGPRVRLAALPEGPLRPDTGAPRPEPAPSGLPTGFRSYDELTPNEQFQLQEQMKDRTAHVGRAETLSTANAQAALRDGPPNTTPMVSRDPQEVAVTFEGRRIMMARDVLSLDPTAADAARSVEDSLLRLSPFVRLSDPTTGELLVQVPNGTSTQDLEGLLGRVTPPQEQIRVQFRDHDGKVLGTFGR